MYIYSLLVTRILEKLWDAGHRLHTEKSNVYSLLVTRILKKL